MASYENYVCNVIQNLLVCELLSTQNFFAARR